MVLVVLANMAVSVMTATPLKLTLLFQHPDLWWWHMLNYVWWSPAKSDRPSSADFHDKEKSIWKLRIDPREAMQTSIANTVFVELMSEPPIGHMWGRGVWKGPKRVRGTMSAHTTVRRDTVPSRICDYPPLVRGVSYQMCATLSLA